MFVTNLHNVGLLAQLVKHYNGIAKVMGSNPVQLTIFFYFGWIFIPALKVSLTAMIIFIYLQFKYITFICLHGYVYHLDNQYLLFYFRAFFPYNLMKNLLDYFYQVPYRGSQYITVLLATPLSIRIPWCEFRFVAVELY